MGIGAPAKESRDGFDGVLIAVEVGIGSGGDSQVSVGADR